MRRVEVVTWLRSPAAIFSGMVLGIVVGKWLPGVSAQVAPFGEVYLSLLAMCILPIVASAIINGLGGLAVSTRARVCLARFGRFAAAGLVMASAVGLVVGFLLGPGRNLSSATQTAIGVWLNNAPEPAGPAAGNSLLGMLHNLIPDNIFYAFSQGQSLQVVFVSLLIALALGRVSSSRREEAIGYVGVVYQVFMKIFDWINVAMPIGVFCLFAAQAEAFSLDFAMVMGRFVLAIYVGGIVVIVFNVLLLRRYAATTGWELIKSLREALVTCFLTSNAFVGLPRALVVLSGRERSDPQITGMVLPLCLVLSRQGNVMSFALVGVFIAQLYGVSIEAIQWPMLCTYAALAGMAAVVDAPALGPLLAFVLHPLGLPAAPALAVLVASNAVVEPMEETINLLAGCALATVVASVPELTEPVSEAGEAALGEATEATS